MNILVNRTDPQINETMKEYSFLLWYSETGIVNKNTIKIFCPYGPKNEIVCAISIGELKENPNIFHGKPDNILPRNHSNNGNIIESKKSLSVIFLPIKLVKRNASPQKIDKRAGKPKKINGIIQKNSFPPVKIELLIQYSETKNQP